MNSDRKKTLIAIDSSYVIKKRRKRLLEKEQEADSFKISANMPYTCSKKLLPASPTLSPS